MHLSIDFKNAIIKVLTSINLKKEMQNYTEEQIADIKDREAKAIEALKELQLNPSAQVVSVNLGNDTFGMKVIPYLADTKFTEEK